MNSKQKIIYTKNCLEFLDYKCVTPNDKDFRIYEGKNSVIPSMVDANFNDDFLNNWNWIMEIIKAIEKLGYQFDITGNEVGVNSNIMSMENISTGGTMNSYNRSYYPTIISICEEEYSKKEAVIQAINQFLIYYNNENNNNRQSR